MGTPETQCLADQTDATRRDLMVILWTPFNGDSQWKRLLNSLESPSMITTDMGSCVFTENRLPVSNAAAVIFNARDIDFEDLPSHRCPWQRWIFFNLDPPVSSGLDPLGWEKANALNFDFVMSYSQQSDILHPLGKILPSDSIVLTNQKVERFVHTFFRRRKRGIWLTNHNCITPGNRENLVRELKMKGIEIDIFGNCPNATSIRPIDENILVDYRFYIAFEDAYCDDYVKVSFKAMAMSYKYGVIPVIYSGASNLHDYLPPGGYIDASNATNIDLVVQQVQRLSENHGDDAWIASFYAWQRSFKVTEGANHNEGLKNLCDKLWSSKSEGSLEKYSEANDLRNRLGNCYQPGTPQLVQQFFF